MLFGGLSGLWGVKPWSDLLWIATVGRSSPNHWAESGLHTYRWAQAGEVGHRDLV